MIAWLALGGCSGRARPASEGTTLRVGSDSDVKPPSPYSTGGLGATIEELVFAGLGRIDDHGALRPWLARWTFSPDGASMTLSLAPGARFSDGSPITCRDVVETYRRAKDVRGVWGIDQIEGIDCEDERTIKVRPVRPHLVPEWFKCGIGKGGGEAIGAGPYVVAAAEKDRLVLRANPHAPAPPGVPVVEFRRFDSTAEAWARLLGGEVDLITSVPWAKAEVIKSIGSVAPVDALSKSVVLIDFVRPRPPFDDAVVRYALALAIDREAIRQGALAGSAAPSVGLVWPRAPAFDAALEPYPYDVREAHRLLASRGFAVDPDGTVRRDGAPFTIDLDYFDGHVESEEIAMLVQQQLDAAGVRVALHARSFAEMNARILGAETATVLRIRHESADLAVDDDARELRPPVDPGAPGAGARALQRRMRDEAPSIYLFWRKRLDVIDRRFCGLPRRPDSPEGALDAIHPCREGEVP